MEVLNLWGCHNVTDASLMALADHMHTLQELNLRYCHRLTDRYGSRCHQSLLSL